MLKILLTQGEPSGIAPFITKKLEYAHSDIFNQFNIFLLISREYKYLYQTKHIKTLYIEDILQKKYEIIAKELNINLTIYQKEQLNNHIEKHLPFILGKIDPIKKSSVLSIYFGALLTYLGLFNAIVTNPIDKKIIAQHVNGFSGHTGFLQKIFKVDSVLMVMDCDILPPIALITEHIPLKQVSSHLSIELIIKKIKILIEKYPLPILPLAITGLNPHAGDGGLIGNEEQEIIIPAINKLRNMGINIEGPISSDAVFMKNNLIKYSAIITLYHDQAMILPKALCFDSLVNITLGLPIIRTSPGHGVGYDLVKLSDTQKEKLISATPLRKAIEVAGKLKH